MTERAPSTWPPGGDWAWGTCVACKRARMVRPHDTLCDECATGVDLALRHETDLMTAPHEPPTRGGGLDGGGTTEVAWEPGRSVVGELWGHLDEVPYDGGLTVDVAAICPSEDGAVVVEETSWLHTATTWLRGEVTRWTAPPDPPTWVGRLLAAQPAPRGDGPSATALVLEDARDGRVRALVRARERQGVARYGTTLRLGNGRDWAADLVQELVDARLYAEGVDVRAARITETALIRILDIIGMPPEEGE